jgi:hypothetical protein
LVAFREPEDSYGEDGRSEEGDPCVRPSGFGPMRHGCDFLMYGLTLLCCFRPLFFAADEHGGAVFF